MKQWHKWLVVAMVLVMAFPLAGCPGGGISSVKLGKETIELELWHTKTGSQEEL